MGLTRLLKRPARRERSSSNRSAKTSTRSLSFFANESVRAAIRRSRWSPSRLNRRSNIRVEVVISGKRAGIDKQNVALLRGCEEIA